MVTITNAISNTLGASNSGATNTLTVTNPSDTANSEAQVLVTVGGTSSADPWTQFSVGSTQSYAIGIDNDDSDKLKITSAASGSIDPSSGSTYQAITSAGEVTFPSTPAFLATKSTNQLNVTGDGSVVTVDFTTEIFDQNSDYDGSNTFTAPVTGRYHITCCVRVANITAGDNYWYISIVSSNRTYFPVMCRPDNMMNGDVLVELNASVLADMDAADTIYIQTMVNGVSGKLVDITSNGYFSAQLAC